jgi:hypothetical protein
MVNGNFKNTNKEEKNEQLYEDVTDWNCGCMSAAGMLDTSPGR